MKVKPIGEPHEGRQTYAFLCPGCALYDERGARLRATHTFDSTWDYNGNGDEPSVRPSILVTGRDGLRCHSFITRGMIVFQDDCSHPFKGRTVDLPELPEGFG